MHRIGFLLLLTALLSACATVQVQRPVDSAATSTAEKLQADGRYGEAAKAWQDSAAQLRGEAANTAMLRAAYAWFLADDKALARSLLANVSRRSVDETQRWRHDMLSAAFDIDAGQSQKALDTLAQSKEAVPSADQPAWLRVRANAYRGVGDTFAAAADLAQAAEALPLELRKDIDSEILALLKSLSNDQLKAGAATLAADHPLYPLAGRELIARGLPLPKPMARSKAFDALPAADYDGYRPPERLAVLLPLSGPLRYAGASVRDGLLAGYYAERRRRPQIRFYDTAKAGVLPAYQSAITEQAQMIVGPLNRNEVTALAAQVDPNIPVLALNRSDTPLAGGASFALTPDDEGIAAAERMLSRGLTKAVLIGERDESARRATSAFKQRFTEKGGEVLGAVEIDGTISDHASTLQPLAQRTAGMAQAIFLSLRAKAARVVVPQLELAGFVSLPKTATSLILAGGGDRRLDRELDGVEYPELPWLIDASIDIDQAENVASTLPSARGAGIRLFAFGLDAWRLVGYFDHLSSQPGTTMRGASGTLSFDGAGSVLREPTWAIFSGGQPRPALDGALIPDAATIQNPPNR